MDYIYLDQSNLKITAETGVTITGALTTLIKYIKPDGTKGEWVAEIEGTQNISFEFSEPSELNQSGWWFFWAYIVFADGRKAPGQSVKIRVYVEGQ